MCQIMIPSRQYHSWLLHVFLILLLHTTGIGSRTIAIANECSEPIWPVVADNSNPEKAEEYGVVPIGSSIAFEKSGWTGRVWGKTGCRFNNSDSASCVTGDTTASVTLIEFALGSTQSSPDFYDVSLVNGYNLPVVVKPINGSGSGCAAAGCVDDLNKSCPAELTTAGGAACRAPCEVFKTAEYCCTEQACGPTNYSRVFKRVCPRAYSYLRDDANSSFYCDGAAAQYLITFCAPSFDSLARSPDTNPIPPQMTVYLTGTNPSPPQEMPTVYQTGTNPSPPPEMPTVYQTGTNPSPTPEMPTVYQTGTNPSPPPEMPTVYQTGTNPSPPQEMPTAYPPSTNPPQTKRERGKIRAKEIITIVSVSVSGVIIVCITVCIFLKRRRHSQNGPKRKCRRDVENLLLQHGSLAPKRYRYLEIKKMTKSLSEKLGQGGFGSVYKGMLPDGRHVAVKILSKIMDSNGEEFINEVASISKTSHVNIVSLLGFCYEGNKSALVYEYMPNKSLDKFLGHDGDGSMDLKKLYEIAVGIAKGLEYLHTGCTTRIVHFDIKPQNILLDDDLCPKISDFGLAKLCKKKQSVLSMLGTRGTAGYIAPEVFSRNFGAVSHKSDVYSYGMMLLEMAGAKKNVGIEEIQSTSENYFPDKIYEQVITDITNTGNCDDESMMIEEEEEGRRKMMLIGFWCIQTIPSDRPSMSKVVEMLEGSVESIQIPPKPFLFSTVIPHQQTSSSSSSFSAIVETDKIAPAS